MAGVFQGRLDNMITHAITEECAMMDKHGIFHLYEYKMIYRDFGILNYSCLRISTGFNLVTLIAGKRLEIILNKNEIEQISKICDGII